MNRAKSASSRMKNHQWKRTEPFDELWFGRLGHRLAQSRHGEIDIAVPQSPDPWSHRSLGIASSVGGWAILEWKVHALVGAMAAFTPAPQGLAGPSLSFGQSNALLMAADLTP